MVPSFNGSDYLIRVFGPDEGFGFLIVPGYEAVDGGLKVSNGAEHTALEAALGEFGKKALYRVEPRTRRRREMECPARMPVQPGPHFGMFGAA